MIQLKVYKTTGDNETALFLDLYETEPIKLTLSIEDITQADATSVFSKTFRVPATRNNNQFFENAYEVDGINFDVTVKKTAQILVDGAEFREGHVRLQKIFRNHDLDRTDYELLFLGETRDFGSVIAEKTLCQINMTDFNWEGLPQNYTNAADFVGPFNYNDIVTSWQAFPQTPSITGGTADGDLLFPLINHGNTYGTDTFPEQPVIALGAASEAEQSFVHSNRPLSQTRLKPMIRAKRIWDQIFEDVNYTYKSDFLNSDRFHQMYVSAFGNNEQIGMEVGQTTGSIFSSTQLSQYDNSYGNYMYNGNVTQNQSNLYNSGGSITGSYFVCPAASSPGGSYYQMSASASMRLEVEQSNGPNIQVSGYVELVVVNSVGGSINRVLAQGSYAQFGNTSTLNWDSRNGNDVQAGEILQVQFNSDSSYVDYDIITNTFWNCTAAPGDYYAPLDLDCQYKQIDFIKDVLTMFRLVMQPDNTRPNNFIIEPWQDFIGSGTTYDWSHKLVEEQDMVLEPLFNTQSATIEFTKAEDEDYINKFHQDNNKHAYGWLRFDSSNELLTGSRRVEVKGIAPTPIDQIESSGANNPQFNPQFVLPGIHTHDDNVSAAEHVPIKPKTRFLFYNGRIPITVSADRWYIQNDNGDSVIQDTFPLVSPYENWPVQQSSLNLNFSNDTRYYITPSPGAGYFNQGSTLFDEYWSRYISSLYDKFSRRLTAYFILNNVDLQYLTFDDIIFVNGKYYRPEKIIDAQVGAETKVQVQLITLNDQRPVWIDEPLTGFSVAVSNDNCVGEQGNIQITTNGTPGFTWELTQSGATGNVIVTGTAPYTFTITAPVGVDTLTVTDSIGRTAIIQVDVPQSQATQVTATSVIVEPTICSDEATSCNGSITITGAGGTGPYTYLYTDGNTSNPRTNLCEGSYFYTVIDSNGCESDLYTVPLLCDDGLETWDVELLRTDCTETYGGLESVSAPNGQLSAGDIITLNEIGGCYKVLSPSQDPAQYTVANDYSDCATCQTSQPTYISWKLQSCIQPADPAHPNATRYTVLDPSTSPGTPSGQLYPGLVVDDGDDAGVYGRCFEVIEMDSVETSNLNYIAIYQTCETCATATTPYYYNFSSCDGLFNGPIESPVELTIGSIIDITPGPGCGTINSVAVGPGTYTYTGSLLYESCNACNGVVEQVCHNITATTNMTFDYQFNGVVYQLSMLAGEVTAICAVVGSVTITSGTGTIELTENACESVRACTIPAPTTYNYRISDCITGDSYNMEKGGCSFIVGDVVQYIRNSNTSRIYCGTITDVSFASGFADSTIYGCIGRDCDDSIHCDIAAPFVNDCTNYNLQNGGQADAQYSYTTCQGLFITDFLGGFEQLTIFCAQTDSILHEQIISVTAGANC